ncbi:type VI secretion system protein TssA [Serratia microhaemolytica]|uniref:type VI secretion system protein TssA n=1 Tax=Serratia microhaemolytica TaxID=2675110 RepID=UPI000FDE41C7|nr:type VI secretion system protein TssA [Serratia microhaemolytica]
METTTQHPWHQLLLTPLTAEQIAQSLVDDDPDWEAIDSQMVKIGSLAHSTLDIEALQQQTLKLLAEKSKDFRLVVHLLRTLQHAGQPDEVMLAITLLTDYIKHFWHSAAPQDLRHKRRFAQQILKRFDTASEHFTQRATVLQRETVQTLLKQLAEQWGDEEATLAKTALELCSSYARAPKPKAQRPVEIAESSDTTSSQAPSLTLDNSNDKAWRKTVLKMADLLCEYQPHAAIGFRLRRHIVWGNITTAPMAQSDGRTPLAAVPADRIADYQGRLPNADQLLWQQVEQSLTLAPYWLDGHVLSAQIALKLGYSEVASVLCDELNSFLARIPLLADLSFSDHTPFLAAESAAWLTQYSASQRAIASGSASGGVEQENLWQCLEQQGLTAALQQLEAQAPQTGETAEPRAHFYHQLLSAQLLEKAGLTTLAAQQYQHLWQIGQQLQLTQWEPALMTLLAEKQRQLTA